ncbi:protein HHL1, chloroplastic-like isoform X5 [Phragmites australis]|uniref:protein HHL1, chloroplastic-like isoform X5 n=1 Tax=Phragmites australis TaxID=29695 RepID=UPI002D77F0AD|nr:protein HHL1, chloroplastic-like isoform X5 [Phragmites australis]
MQQQRRAPQLPKIEDDGNPRFVMFIRTANVYFWYPLNVVTGGTTAKIMLASKDNFLGKYIYKDTLARNLAAVIYKITGSALSKDAEQAEGEEEKFRSKRRKKRKSKDGGMILSLSTSGAVRQAKQDL